MLNRKYRKLIPIIYFAFLGFCHETEDTIGICINKCALNELGGVIANTYCFACQISGVDPPRQRAFSHGLVDVGLKV